MGSSEGSLFLVAVVVAREVALWLQSELRMLHKKGPFEFFVAIVDLAAVSVVDPDDDLSVGAGHPGRFVFGS